MIVASTTPVDKVVVVFTVLKQWRIVAQFAGYDLMAVNRQETVVCVLHRDVVELGREIHIAS